MEALTRQYGRQLEQCVVCQVSITIVSVIFVVWQFKDLVSASRLEIFIVPHMHFTFKSFCFVLKLAI